MSAVVWANILLTLPFLIAFIGLPLWLTFHRPETAPTTLKPAPTSAPGRPSRQPWLAAPHRQRTSPPGTRLSVPMSPPDRPAAAPGWSAAQPRPESTPHRQARWIPPLASGPAPLPESRPRVAQVGRYPQVRPGEEREGEHAAAAPVGLRRGRRGRAGGGRRGGAWGEGGLCGQRDLRRQSGASAITPAVTWHQACGGSGVACGQDELAERGHRH